MKLLTILLYLICLNSFAIAKSKPTVMPEKWHNLVKLINIEKKTIKSLKRLGPRLRFRLLELQTEMIALIKEKENKKFITSKVKKSKKSYFKKSRALYYKTRKEGLAIAKKWPRFRSNSAIYYTLALNARDYGGDKETEFFLKKALKLARKNDPITHNARTSLAEYYYNNKKYKKAIRYYRYVLKNKNDEWYSKHLFNISWCYLKTNKYSLAIESQRAAYFASTSGKYLSVKDQVLGSIGIFHVMGKQVKSGTMFYIDNVKKPGKYIIKMANKSADNGSFKDVRYLLTKALDNSIKNGSRSEQIEIHLAELKFYRNFKRFELYFAAATLLKTLHKKEPLTKEHQEDVVTKIKSLVGWMQVKISKNKQINNHEYSKADLNRIITYFNYLAIFNPDKTEDYRFFQGETYYSVGLYKNAYKFYKNALNFSLKKFEENKNKAEESKVSVSKAVDKLRTKILNSLLAVLENGDFDVRQNYSEFVFVYKNHLKLWPINNTSKLLYQKLFNTYMSKLNIKEALGVITTYNKFYPKDIKDQRAMFTKIMDFHIKKQNADKLSSWIAKLEAGFLTFSKSYIKQSVVILGSILFKKYQNLEHKDGKKSAAAKGYISLYENKKYPKKIRGDAAFNAALLYLKLQEVSKSLTWIKNAWPNVPSNELFKKRETISAMIQKYHQLQNFDSAAILSSMFFTKYCSRTYKENNTFFSSSINLNILNKNYPQVYKTIQSASSCNIKTKKIAEARKIISEHFYENRKYRHFFHVFKKYKRHKEMTAYYQQKLLDIYWDTYSNQLPKLSRSTLSLLGSLNKRKKLSKKIQVEYSLIRSFNKHKKYLSPKGIGVIVANPKFDEKKFNHNLAAQFSKLKEVTSKARPYIESGNPIIMLQSYSLIIKAYAAVKKGILAYSPLGVPQDFVIAFKKQMIPLANNLQREIFNYTSTAKKLISKNHLFNTHALFFFKGYLPLEELRLRYPASLLAMPMDSDQKLGGRK